MLFEYIRCLTKVAYITGLKINHEVVLDSLFYVSASDHIVTKGNAVVLHYAATSHHLTTL